MTLALPRVRRNLHTKRANQNLPPLVLSAFLRIRQYNPRRSQKLLQGPGGYPHGVARAPPWKFDHGKYSLHSSASAQMETRGLLSRVSVSCILNDARKRDYPYAGRGPRLDALVNHTYSHRRPQPRRRKGRRANRSGLERQLPSNTETGSSEPGGVKRKDAARRLTRAREPGHLMRLSRSHLTRQSREA